MPVSLHFGADDLLRIRFAVSPLCETHEAVRTLCRADRHGYHAPWLRRMRETLTGLDLTPLWLFMPSASPGYTPDFLGRPPDTPMAGFGEELARLRATDPALARAEMAKSLAGRPDARSRRAAGRRWPIRRGRSRSWPMPPNGPGGRCWHRTGHGCGRCWRPRSLTGHGSWRAADSSDCSPICIRGCPGRAAP